jgi:hypothetical protein
MIDPLPVAGLSVVSIRLPLQSTGSVVAATAIPALTWAVLVAWVGQDALAREAEHPLRWAGIVAVAPPLLVVYVSVRGERTRSQSDRERLTLTLLLALLSAMLVGTVFAPPDVFAQPRNTFGALLVTLPLFYLLVYRQSEQPVTEDPAS